MNISMFCIRSSRLFYKKHVELVVKCSASSSATPLNENQGTERNPTPVFFSREVQRLLNQLTSLDMKKVFTHKRDQRRLKAPTYQFMTADELEMALNEAKQKARKKLQMPPVVLPRKPFECVLAKDTVLKSYDDSKYVFTDITYGVSNRDRFIVVREPDGTLRKALWEERDRLNQCYFPVKGRSWNTPKMFEKEYLERLLSEEEFVFILDRACIQFEPDDPLYISVTNKVYEHMDEIRAYERLRSTRHFGPLAFYLAWNNKVDNLVLDCIQNQRIDDAVRTIQLLHIIHPNLKSAATKFNKDQDPLEYIKAYIELDSKKKSSMELALQNHEETLKQLQQVSSNLKEAHGQT